MLTTDLVIITNCTDRMMWYAGFVGDHIKLIKPHNSDPTYYWATDSSGYTNIILKEDAKLVHTD